MATINFLYRSTRDSSNLDLRLLFRHDNTDFVIGGKTKLTVSKSYWQKLHNLKKPKDIDIINQQHDINSELNNLESHILNTFHKCDPSNINKEWLSKSIETYYNPKSIDIKIPNSLVSYIQYFIDQKTKEVTPASITKFKVIKHKLERLEQHYNRSIYLEEVDEDFKKLFVDFCKIESYSTNTIQRELGLIKTFCKHARAKGVEVSPQMDALKIKKEKVNHIYLSFDELDLIEKSDLEHEHLVNARDWLIISCYMGQRVSDFIRFNKNMIRVENGTSLIEFKQKKTNKLMTIPLHPKVIKILNYRNGDFPRKISNQRYNDYIKTVCYNAKLNTKIKGRKQENIAEEGKPKIIRNVEKEYEKWELVSSHIGRRSFASNYYGQIPTSFLIYVTGHSTEAMFLQYIGKSNKDIAMELTKYF